MLSKGYTQAISEQKKKKNKAQNCVYGLNLLFLYDVVLLLDRLPAVCGDWNTIMGSGVPCILTA